MTEKELRELIKSQLGEVIKEENLVAEMKNPRKVFDYSKLTSSQIEKLEDLYAKFTKGDKPEGVNELTEAMDMNDPFMIQVRLMRHASRERKAYMQYLKDNPKPKVRKISFDKYLELLDTQTNLLDDLKDLTRQLKQTDSDMNNEAGQKGDKWTDDDGNRYGAILMDLEAEYEKVKAKLTKVEAKIEKYNMLITPLRRDAAKHFLPKDRPMQSH